MGKALNAPSLVQLDMTNVFGVCSCSLPGLLGPRAPARASLLASGKRMSPSSEGLDCHTCKSSVLMLP